MTLKEVCKKYGINLDHVMESQVMELRAILQQEAHREESAEEMRKLNESMASIAESLKKIADKE